MSFQAKLDSYITSNNSENANRLLMQELGKTLINSKLEFVQLLQGSDIEASIHDNDEELVNKFVDGIGNNRKLLIGSALLVNMKNKTIGFDGEEKISDNGVKQAYKTMYLYFDEGKYDVEESTSDRFYNIGGGWADAVSQVSQLGQKAVDARRNKKYGASDALQKKVDAKNQIIQGALTQKQEEAKARQKEAEAKSKTTKTLLIVGGSLVGVLLIVGLVYILKKKK